MRAGIFKAFKTLESIVGTYFWILVMALLTIFNMFEYKDFSLRGVRLRDVKILNQASTFIIDKFMAVFICAIVISIVVVLIADVKPIKKVIGVVMLMLILLSCDFLNNKLFDLAIVKLNISSNVYLISCVHLAVLIVLFTIFECIKGILRFGSLDVPFMFNYRKIDALIEQYNSDEYAKVNVSLCDDLIKRYGGKYE